MEAIKDCHGHLVCMADAAGGFIEIKCGHTKIKLQIEEGQSFTVFRDDSITDVKRCENARFLVSRTFVLS